MSDKDAAIDLIRSLPDGVTGPEIVARLEERFGPPDLPEEDSEAAWAETINRRVEELESGKVQGIPAEEVLRRGRRKQP